MNGDEHKKSIEKLAFQISSCHYDHSCPMPRCVLWLVQEEGPPGLLRLKSKTKKSFTSHLDWEHMDGNSRILSIQQE